MTKESALAALREAGFAILEPLDPAEIAAVNAWLCSRPAYPDVHVPVHAFQRGTGPIPRAEAAAKSECWCVSNADALKAPYLFERALSASSVAAEYLGKEPPVLYSASAFWTRPGIAAVRPDTQDFHRDVDDERFLPMFCYLADVLTDDDGPQDLEGPDGVIRTIYGPAGTVFLADTMRLHRGRKPRSKERGLFWFRFGVSERPAANVWDKIEPISVDEFGTSRYPAGIREREMVKLLVR